MFSRRVEHVSATKIFAAGLPDGRQSLIYSMSVAIAEPLAMLLPLPVPPGGPDDAVDFVNLEGYAEVFDDLKRAFPDLDVHAQTLLLGPPRMSSNRSVLKVHAVGAFEASYVPRASDFDRLDPRFRLPPSVLNAMPTYEDWGFAVFQLAPTAKAAIHPMALRFPRREPASIFFPTTHVHDGAVPATARFDHSLYAQFPAMIGALSNWQPSHDKLGKYVNNQVNGLLDPYAGGHTTSLLGDFPNGDVWLGAPDDVTIDDMSGRGGTYAYRVKATYFYATRSHHQYPRWRDTTANKLSQLCRGIRSALAELTTRNARAWQLGPLADSLDPHFINGDQLWIGSDYREGRFVAEPRGPGRVTFRPFSELVEPQEIELAFVALPSQEDARDIDRENTRSVERSGLVMKSSLHRQRRLVT
jgi:hypothetical protein